MWSKANPTRRYPEFFPSISVNRLEKVFIKYGLKEEIAKNLADFVTIDGYLGVGLHTSPLLSNLTCIELDRKLVELASEYNAQYSRYADDITISGNEVPTKQEISSKLSEEGFTLSERKFRIIKQGQAQYVTGLSVSDPCRPRIPRAFKRRLRQELYYCNKYGIEDHLNRINRQDTQKEVNRIDGSVRYIGYIEKQKFLTLKSNWNGLLKKNKLQVSYYPRRERAHRNIKYYIDEKEIEYNGNKYLCLCLVQIQDNIAPLRVFLRACWNDYNKDPFTTGRKNKKNLHYTDDHPDLRKRIAGVLATADFKGYVAYKLMGSESSYEFSYFECLRKLLPDRFMDSDESNVEIYLEENSNIKKPRKINDVIKDIYQSLEDCNNRRPYQWSYNILKKPDDILLSVPDYLLGIWGRYISHSDSDEKVLFEKLRDKYHKIINLEKSIIFSRRYPFIKERF